MKILFNTLLYTVLFLTIQNISVKAQINTDNIIHTAQLSENLISPGRMCLDQNDNLYITDHNQNSIIKYDASGSFTEKIMLDFAPLSIAVNRENELYIGNKNTGEILMRNEDGKTSLFYSGCVFPASIEFSPEGLLYIVDSKLKQVIVLDVSANIVKTIGTGILIYPSSIAFDKKNQRILIGEHGGIGTGFTPVCKIWVFDSDGNLLSSFGSYGDEDGEFYRIQGITIGKCGHIFVSESYQGNISVFDENGNFLTKFGEFGNQADQLNLPLGIVSDSQERIFVSSMNNGNVNVFNLTDTLPSSNIIHSDAILCSGESTDIIIELTGTAPWSFTYTINGLNPTNIITNDSINILSVSEPGIYEIVELSDANYPGTCFTGSAVVEVTENIPTSNISIENNIICDGEITNINIDLTGIAPWEFNYTIDGLMQKTIKTTNNPYLLSVSKEGTYEITSLTGNGCVGTEFFGSAQISVIPLPTSSFISGNDAVSICKGSNAELFIELTGTAPWSFSFMADEEDTTQISNIMTNPYVLSSPLTGSYEIIQITDANCTNYSTLGYPDVIELQKSIPDFNFEITGRDVIYTNSSQYADSYFWDFGDGFFSTEINPSHSYETSDTFPVCLTNSNVFCEDVQICKSIEIANTSISQIDFENKITVYPNPSSGSIHIEMKEFNTEIFNIEIYNVIGRKIFSTKLNNNGTVTEIDLTEDYQGILFITISSDKYSTTKKIIIN